MNRTGVSRRRFAQAVGAAGALSTLGACATSSSPKKLGRVLVVGGGFGGATAAKYLKLWGGDSIDVTLVERNTQFVSCPISNLVIGGSRKIGDVTMDYGGLRERRVLVLNDEVTDIDPVKKRVKMKKVAQ